MVPKVLSPWSHRGPQTLMSQAGCQSQGLRTRETGAPGGPKAPLVQDPCPGPRDWRPPACPSRLLGSADRQAAWPWPEKGLTRWPLPPPLSGNVTVMRVQTASDFILPRTDGETEARGGKVCPPRCLPLFLRHPHQRPLSLCRPPLVGPTASAHEVTSRRLDWGQVTPLVIPQSRGSLLLRVWELRWPWRPRSSFCQGLGP